MKKETTLLFHPMIEPPEQDNSDETFSKTVLVYSEQLDFIELGYFDFEDKQWYHFGNESFLLKCWCYIPNPELVIHRKDWIPVKHKGYKNISF